MPRLSAKQKGIPTVKEAEAVACCIRHMDKCESYRDKPTEDNPMRGKCYVASVALLEYLGGVPKGYHLTKGEDKHGDHYWVENNHHVVLDPTEEQFKIMGIDPPYGSGRYVGRRNTFKQHLSLLEAMRADTEVEEETPSLDVFGNPIEVLSKDRALSEAQAKRLDVAWALQIVDWSLDYEDFLKVHFSKGALALHFVRAQIYGEEIPRTATMAYTPHRFYVAGSEYPFNEMFDAAVGDDDERRDRIRRGIRFVMGKEGDIGFPKLISSNLPVLGYRIPNDFPISLAKQLINRYCPEGGKVLDPCHGWGGRLVGFMLSHALHYTGIDPAPHSPCLQQMFDDLSVFLYDDKKINLINKPFEDVSDIQEASYDFAMTSPPYFNTEKYDGDESSWRRYEKLDEWMDGFYMPLIEGVAMALKPGALFALQVTPKLKMVEEAQKIGETCGLKYVGTDNTVMRRYNSVTAKNDTGSTEPFEVIALFQRT